MQCTKINNTLKIADNHRGRTLTSLPKQQPVNVFRLDSVYKTKSDLFIKLLKNQIVHFQFDFLH